MKYLRKKRGVAGGREQRRGVCVYEMRRDRVGERARRRAERKECEEGGRSGNEE